MALLVKQPISILDRKLRVSWRELLRSLGKSAVDAASLNTSGLAKDLVELGAAVGLVEEPGEVAWLLIRRSLTRALADLLREHRDLFAISPPEDTKLAEAEAALSIDDEVLEDAP